MREAFSVVRLDNFMPFDQVKLKLFNKLFFLN